MGALGVLLAVAAGLVGVGRVLPRVAPFVALAGVGAAGWAVLGGPVATLSLGLAFGVDGVSGVVLGALFLLAACGGVSAVVAGALGLGVLAADGVGLVAFLAGGALLAAPSPRPSPAGGRGGRIAALLFLGAAMLALGGLDPRFAAMRAGPLDGVRGAVVLVAAVGGAAGLMASVPRVGGLMAVYVLARVLLDLAGTTTPGWWGVPVLVVGAGAAVLGALRAAGSEDLVEAGGDAGLAVAGVAVLGLGAALLARGADQLPLAAMAVGGALLQVVGWGVWGGLLALSSGVVAAGAGGAGLARLGGLMRLAPATGLSMLVALLSMAALPVSAGFAGVWVVLQAVLGAGRGGGLGVLALVAGAAAALGLAMALLAGAAIRLGGLALLGGPRSGRAAGMVEPRRLVRLGMGGLAAAALLLGVMPWLGVALVRPGARLLAGSGMEGAGFWMLGSAEGPGYAAPVVGGLLVLMLGAIGFGAREAAGREAAGREAAGRAAAWNGGFAEDGVGRGNLGPRPGRVAWWAGVDWGRAGLVGLGLVLAAALGWAAR